MYLKHFNIHEYPFTLTPNTQFYCDLSGAQAALDVLLFSLKHGEGFIKVTGEVGSGKTLLCRKFLNILDDNYVTAYLPNPDLEPFALRKALAHEFGVTLPSHNVDQSELLQLLYTKLVQLNAKNKKVVLLIDEAQVIPDASLEALRLLTNLETESKKLLQIILFAQPELDARLKQHKFRQLNQRITFSCQLPALKRKEVFDYLMHRLSIAGHTKGLIFTNNACKLLSKASQGIPRVINILSHKAMLSAYGRGKKNVGRKDMVRAIRDSRSFVFPSFWKRSEAILNHVMLYVDIVLFVMVIAAIFCLVQNLQLFG